MITSNEIGLFSSLEYGLIPTSKYINKRSGNLYISKTFDGGYMCLELTSVSPPALVHRTGIYRMSLGAKEKEKISTGLS